MQGTISKWGNSLAIRLPRWATEEALLKEGSLVEIDVTNGVITLSQTRVRYSLAELLEGEAPQAYDWGAPMGEEAWRSVSPQRQSEAISFG